MKKSIRLAFWIGCGTILILFVLVVVTNTVPYFTEPRKIDAENCDLVSKSRAAKAMSVQEQHPALVDKKGDFQAYYNTFYNICIKAGI